MKKEKERKEKKTIFKQTKISWKWVYHAYI